MEQSNQLPPPQEINPIQISGPVVQPQPQPVVTNPSPEPSPQKQLKIKAADGPKPLKYLFSVLFLTLLFVLVILFASYLKQQL